MSAKGGDTFHHWHYATVKSYDSAKGLVYASNADDEKAPEFEASVDVKWYDEINSNGSEGRAACIPLWAYAQASEGYAFTGWSNKQDVNKAVSTYNPSQLPTTADDWATDYPDEPTDVYYALFGKVGGTVDPLSMANRYGAVEITNPLNGPGDKVTLSATSNFPNVRFAGWTLGGAEYSTEPEISLTAGDSPAVYCANFRYESKTAYSFDKEGEWRIYYEPTISALKPTSASEAYVLPSSHLYNSGTFQLLPVDTLYAGTTYILYGEGDGEIEYIEPRQELPREVDSALEYADKDIKYTEGYDHLLVYRPESKTFEPLREAGTIKQGEAYLYRYDDGPETYTFTGIIEPELEFIISSYRVTDLLTNTAKVVTEPQCLTLTYTKNVEDFLNVTDVYVGKNFFGYNCWSQTFDYSAKDINLQSWWLGFMLSSEEDIETGYVNETAFSTDREWLENPSKDKEYDPVKITYDVYSDTYRLTPFYIYTAVGKFTDEGESSDYEITGKYYYDEIVIKKSQADGVISPIVKGLDVRVANGTIYLDAKAKVRVCNMQGITIYDGETNIVEGLSNGLYILTVEDASIKVKI